MFMCQVACDLAVCLAIFPIRTLWINQLHDKHLCMVRCDDGLLLPLYVKYTAERGQWNLLKAGSAADLSPSKQPLFISIKE